MFWNKKGMTPSQVAQVDAAFALQWAYYQAAFGVAPGSCGVITLPQVTEPPYSNVGASIDLFKGSTVHANLAFFPVPVPTYQGVLPLTSPVLTDVRFNDPGAAFSAPFPDAFPLVPTFKATSPTGFTWNLKTTALTWTPPAAAPASVKRHLLVFFYPSAAASQPVLCNVPSSAGTFTPPASAGIAPDGTVSIQLRDSVAVDVGGEKLLFGGASLATFNFTNQ
ncbi:MAG: hypothetical protein U0263_16830 [Polyangiaceae bacterium]